MKNRIESSGKFEARKPYRELDTHLLNVLDVAMGRKTEDGRVGVGSVKA